MSCHGNFANQRSNIGYRDDRSFHPAALGSARYARPGRHQVWLWYRPVWRLHRASERRASALLPDSGGQPYQRSHHHNRRARCCRWLADQGASSLGCRRRTAMRLLPGRPDHERHCAVATQPESNRRRHRRRHVRQPVPLRHLHPHQTRHQGGCWSATCNGFLQRSSWQRA